MNLQKMKEKKVDIDLKRRSLKISTNINKFGSTGRLLKDGVTKTLGKLLEVL